MKKKLLLILLSVAMVVAMMPLSVFAGEQKVLVRTDIGNTGFYLLGDRTAIEGEGDDYFIDGDDRVSIRTSGWTIGGENLEMAVFVGNGIEIEETAITITDGFHADQLVFEYGKGIITAEGNSYLERGIYMEKGSILGTGNINVLNGLIAIGQGKMNEATEAAIIDGPTIDVTTPQDDTDIFCAMGVLSDLNFKSGKLILTNRCEAVESMPALVVLGGIQIGENAEIFANAQEVAIAAMDASSLVDRGVLGDASQKSYDQKETVVSEVSLVDYEIFGTPLQSFALNEANETIAKTIRTANSKHTVEIRSSLGFPLETQTVEDGECAIEPEVPAIEGYEFDGWYTVDEELEEHDFSFNTPITEDLIVFARMVRIFEVKFVVDGSVYTTQEVARGYNAKVPVDPVKDGYKFTGWYLDEKTTEIFDFNTPITDNLTLYAGWEKVEPTPVDPTKPDKPANGGGVNTGDNAVPIVLISFGFVAVVAGFTAYRRLRDR